MGVQLISVKMLNRNLKKFHLLQIEGSDCHHGADELVGRCLALHQQCREEGQASSYAQVRWVLVYADAMG